MDLIAAIDGATHGIKWAVIGRTVRQHSPRVTPDGSILVFDNLGGDRETGGSRIVRLTYGEDTVETVFPGPDTPEDINFWTRQVGHIDPHPDGSRALVSLTGQGRFLEIDLRRGRVLWELVNSHDLNSAGRQFGFEEDEVVRLAADGSILRRSPAVSCPTNLGAMRRNDISASRLGAIAAVMVSGAALAYQPILGLTTEFGAAGRPALLWGLHAVACENVKNIAEMVEQACRHAVESGIAKTRSSLVITAGVPFGTPGSTNFCCGSRGCAASASGRDWRLTGRGAAGTTNLRSGRRMPHLPRRSARTALFGRAAGRNNGEAGVSAVTVRARVPLRRTHNAL